MSRNALRLENLDKFELSISIEIHNGYTFGKSLLHILVVCFQVQLFSHGVLERSIENVEDSIFGDLVLAFGVCGFEKFFTQHFAGHLVHLKVEVKQVFATELFSKMSLGPVNVRSTMNDSNCIIRLLINALQILNALNRIKSSNHTSKDAVLAVHESQRRPSSDIELTLISVLHSASLAHAEHANLVVLHVEAFILKFFAIGTRFTLVNAFNAAALDEHTGANTVDFAVLVGDDRGFLVFNWLVDGLGQG